MSSGGVETNHFILATAGHVDHGKSSLVKALTGIDPDRLPEEKARGITIDLGFAHLELQTTIDNRPRILRVGLVDVPGHEDFVKNMVAGVGSIDLALFVVAADDGWMPQTEEHLQILTYLGVARAVVALTKIDLAEDEPAVLAAVRAKLADSAFAGAPIIPTSTVTGRGLEELKKTLAEALANTPPPRDIGKPRLWVDRVFTLRGAGTIITGTLMEGPLQRGQAVAIQPSGKISRIRTIQSHNQQVEGCGPGTRTALNLPDVEMSSGVQRGDVITLQELGQASDTWDVLLERSGRSAAGKSAATRPLKNGARVRLHIGSANMPGHVHFLETTALAPGGKALAQFRFESPLFGFNGDRFVVRDWPEQQTLAGGIVLNVDAQRRDSRSEGNRRLLEARAQCPDQAIVLVESQLKRDGVADQAKLQTQSRFSAVEIERAVRQLAAENKAVMAESLVADAAWWKALRQIAGAAIDAAHAAHPDHAGLPINELRARLKGYLRLPQVFDILLRDLCRSGFVQAGVVLGRGTHRPGLPSHLEAAGAKIRKALSAKPLDPPSRKELSPDAASQQVLRFLLQTGEAVAVGDEIVLLADSLATAVQVTTRLLQSQGAATAGELRQALGTSRRVVIPLLEYLDKQGVTRREGDKRVLKKG